MPAKRRLLSIVTACYNEEENVEPLRARVREVLAGLKGYDHEHIFIDNCSTDKTAAALRRMAARDPKVKVILNARNFGHIRSPFHALMQAQGDAVVSLVADFQDPPELIPELVRRWERGYRIVAAVKSGSRESALFFAVRRLYYWLVGRLSEVRLIPNFTGFGLYDRRVIEILRGIDDPYPYFRGLICDIGFEPSLVPYVQPQRQRGFTKNNFGTLYDLAMLGITTHSRVPLRLATMAGFALSGLCFLAALGYLVYKLLFWNSFSVGIAPMVIGVFFVAAVQLLFIGILGEYLGNIQTQVLKRPRVVERERINF